MGPWFRHVNVCVKRDHKYFIHQWLYSPLLGRGLFFSFVIFFTQSVELLGRVISPSQDHYLTHRITQTQNRHTQIFIPLSGIRTHDPSVRASEDSSCLKARGHRDRRSHIHAGTRNLHVNKNKHGHLGRPDLYCKTCRSKGAAMQLYIKLFVLTELSPPYTGFS
jgi:hypothetical protein